MTRRTRNSAAFQLYTPEQRVRRDNSRWNDVYRTLRGQYGARSSRDVQQDETSGVMYVAAPVRAADGRIIGVVAAGVFLADVRPLVRPGKGNSSGPYGPW